MSCAYPENYLEDAIRNMGEMTEYAHEACAFAREEWPPALVRYDADASYWCGYMAAYYQWRRNLPFGEIFHAVPYATWLVMYPALHTASEEKLAEVLDGELLRLRTRTRLQEYRRHLKMSQKELAEASGVNLRTLQQYENGDKEIGRAAAESVIALAQVLHCRPERLLN